MKRRSTRRVAWAAALSAVAALVAAAVAAQGATTASAPAFVIDNSFTIKTTDPQRAFDPTGSIVDRALYDTLFTYKGNDLAHPIPLLVQAWTASKDAKTFTFKLKQNVSFADGTPLGAGDVVFSLKRLINLKGNPSFLLAGVTASARGKYTDRKSVV